MAVSILHSDEGAAKEIFIRAVSWKIPMRTGTTPALGLPEQR